MRFSKCLSAFGTLLACAPSAFAAFGVTSSGGYYTVDCGSANTLVFKVSQTSGDVTSLVYRGVEYQYASQGSHINSGLGTATVSATTIGSYIKITIATSTLTHYLVAKSGESNIYMATYITAEPTVGELRWIARLNSALVPNADQLGATTAGGTAIEASDVYLVDGQTRSKFYSSERFIEDQVHCVYGDDVHICMIMPDTAYETSIGGPFHRDINYNNGGSYHALYWYMNSGHVPTETTRTGLMGPYVMTFSRSGTPTADSFDTSFFSTLSITGYVAASGRGYVSGTTAGVSSAFQRVLHWYNSGAQYWAAVGSTYTSPAMKPGVYTMKYYRGEFPIATSTVTVKAGATATANMVNNEAARTVLWSIGDLDGKPTGFRNAANQLRMHPTDSRMSSWSPLTFAVGAAVSGFPMAQVKAVNDATTITFTLSSTDAAAAANIRVATTLSFAGGRPSITINGKTYSAAAPTKIDSRGLTRGAYRGYGEVYDFALAAGVLVSGANTLAISCISGSTGDDFLEPNFIYDSVQLWR